VRSLILADRNERRLRQSDVGGLEDRVCQQAVVDVLGLVRALLLVGRSALQPADRRHGVEEPAQLGDLRPMRLDKDGASFRVKAQGDQGGRHLEGLAAQHLRIVDVCQGVVVDDAVDRLIAILQSHVIADRAQVVAQVRPAGGLMPL